MADTIGSAVYEVGVDTRAVDAGLKSLQNRIASAVTGINTEFSKIGAAETNIKMDVAISEINKYRSSIREVGTEIGALKAKWDAYYSSFSKASLAENFPGTQKMIEMNELMIASSNMVAQAEMNATVKIREAQEEKIASFRRARAEVDRFNSVWGPYVQSLKEAEIETAKSTNKIVMYYTEMEARAVNAARNMALANEHLAVRALTTPAKEVSYDDIASTAIAERNLAMEAQYSRANAIYNEYLLEQSALHKKEIANLKGYNEQASFIEEERNLQMKRTLEEQTMLARAAANRRQVGAGAAIKTPEYMATIPTPMVDTKKIDPAPIAKVGDELKKAAHEADLMDRTLGRIMRSMASLAAIMAAFKIYQAFSDAVTSGIAFNSMMEDSKIGIASMLASTQDFLNAQGKVKDFQGSWIDATRMAAEVQERLQIANLKTAATYEQLLRAYQGALPYAAAAKFDPKQTEAFTVGVVKAASAMQIPLDQLNEEMRSILMGTMQPRQTRLYPLMIAAGLTNEKIKELSKSGKLFDAIMSAFSATEQGATDALNTFTTRLSNLKDAFSIFSGTIFKTSFDYLKKVLDDLQKSFVNISEDSQKITIKENLALPFDLLNSAILGALKSMTWLIDVVEKLSSQWNNLGVETKGFVTLSMQIGGVVVGLNAVILLLSKMGTLLMYIAGMKTLTSIGTWTAGIASSVGGLAVTIAGFSPMIASALLVALTAAIIAGIAAVNWGEIWGAIMEYKVAHAKLGDWLELAKLRIKEGMWDIGTTIVSKLEQMMIDMIDMMWKKLLELKEKAGNLLSWGTAETGDLGGRTEQPQTFPKPPPGPYSLSPSLLERGLGTVSGVPRQMTAAEKSAQIRAFVWNETLASKIQAADEAANVPPPPEIVSRNKNMPDLGKTGAGPKDMEYQFEQYQRKVEDICQKLRDSISDYYISISEYSGSYYEAEAERARKWEADEIHKYSQTRDELKDQIDKLQRDASKAKKGITPGSYPELEAAREALTMLDKEFPGILQHIKDRKDLMLEIANAKVWDQEATDAASLRKEIAELTGTTYDQVQAQIALNNAQNEAANRGKTSPEAQEVVALRNKKTALQNMREEALKGGSMLDGFNQAWADASRNMVTNGELGADVFKQVTSSIDSAADSLAEFCVTGKMSFSDFAQSMIKDLLKLQIQLYMTRAIIGTGAEGGGGLLGGLMGLFGMKTGVSSVASAAPAMSSGEILDMIFTQHNGTMNTSRMVPASYFFDAPRLHKGLIASDEYPAILQKGESVIPKGQSIANSSNITVNVTQNGGGGSMRDAQQLGDIIAKAVDAKVTENLNKQRRNGGLLDRRM